jgi:hypothetical protein
LEKSEIAMPTALRPNQGEYATPSCVRGSCLFPNMQSIERSIAVMIHHLIDVAGALALYTARRGGAGRIDTVNAARKYEIEGMPLDPLKFTVSGPDIDALTIALTSLPQFSMPPTLVNVDDENMDPEPGWAARWLPTDKRKLWVEFPNDGLLWQTRTTVLASSPAFCEDPIALTRIIAELPFELTALWTPFGSDWQSAGYRGGGFSDRHLSHGWACMFKGAGHDRLVSRRRLEHGPWKLSHYGGDVSIVQFHAWNASESVAFQQAKVGHERMSISRTGGFLQTNPVYYHRLNGVYDPAHRAYKIPVAVRELPQTEMLDACTLRAEKRNDPETPIDLVGFAFVMGEDEARPYLHELWLRELACWAVVEGSDVRLDTGYTPLPNKPPW